MTIILAMDIENLVSIYEANVLSRGHSGFVRKVARPVVDMKLIEYDQRVNSQFGGVPLIPANFDWPVSKVGVYRFLGQLDFSEIENPPEDLPKMGLLSLFYNWDEDGEAFWGDDGYVVGYYWADIGSLARADELGVEFQIAKSVMYSNGVMAPLSEELLDDWPFDPEVLYEIGDDLRIYDNYLLGYPTFNTLAYNPAPGPEWVSILNLISRDDLEWCWHDFDRLMVYMEKEKLMNNDFTMLKSDAG